MTAARSLTQGEGRGREALAVVGVVLVALALRLFHLTAESLWYDEAYAVWSSRMEIASLRILWEWRIEFALYYVLLHFWMRLFGAGELAVRGLSALAGTLTILPLYALGKALWGRRGGLWAAFLLALNPYHIWYSQEVRSYVWVVLFAVVSLYAYWRLWHGGRWPWWVLHALATGLAFHLHYYIGWIVLMQNAYYLSRLLRQGVSRESWRTLRWWLLDQAGVVLLALPALAIFWTYLGRNQWSWLAASYRPPRLRELWNLLQAFTTGTTFPGPALLRRLAVLPFLGCGACGAWTAYRERDARGAAFLLVGMAFLLPVGAVFALGQVAMVWVLRYLLVALPAFVLWVAWGVASLPGRTWRAGALAVLVAVSLLALWGMYRTPQKEDWRGVAAQIGAQATEQDLIVLMDEDCRVPFNYYYGAGGRRVEVSRFADDAALARAVATVRAQQRGGRLWVVVSHADGSRLEVHLQAVPGLVLEQAQPLAGIRLLRYVWS